MTTVIARYTGSVLVPDAPLDLREGETVELSIRRRPEPSTRAADLLSRLPAIRLAPQDAEAINRDPAFDVEEA